MSMQEFDISRPQRRELQQDFDTEPREQYQEESQEESRHEPQPPLLNAPYSIEEKIRTERLPEYTPSSRAGFLPAIILMGALGLMGLGGLLGYSLSHSDQFVSPAEPIPPVYHYYSHPHFDHHFDGPFYDNDGQ